MGGQPAQLSFFEEEPPIEEDDICKDATPGDRPPVFWIEEVRILRTWSASPRQQLRQIHLRRGMNIIWAPPLDVDDIEVTFSGHAAGKTSFCRLLRYALGEPRCGSKFLRERLMARLPRGWVIARIWVDGKPWIVGRPFSSRRRSICVQAEDIDAWLKTKAADANDYEIFRVTVHQAVVEQLPVKSYGDSGQSIRFLHLLAWLARDQECRLDGLLAWRHKDSQSGSPPLSAGDRSFLIRSVVGLMDREIRQEMEYRVSMEDDLKRLPSEILFRQRTVEEAIKELTPYIDDAHASIADPLFSIGIENQLRSEEKRELDALQPDGVLTIDEQRLALDRTLESLGAAKYAVTLWDSEPCGVAPDLAHAHCPFHVDAPEPIPRKGVLVTQSRKRDALHALETAATRVVELQDVYADALHKDEVQRREHERIRSHFRLVHEHLERATSAQTTLDALIEMRNNLTTEIATSQERQEALQRRWDREASRFAALYRRTMRRMLGRGTDAECRFTREKIVLKATYNGDLNSAAINTLITLGFDLAVLQASVLDQGHHPRFLIHDSPREADMDANLYRRVFTYMQALEPEAGEANFQYIISTTEAPPKNFCQEPWLRLLLDASKGKKRLFRMDL